MFIQAKMVFYYLTFITILAAISPLVQSFSDFLPGILFSFIFLALYSLGLWIYHFKFGRVVKKKIRTNSRCANWYYDVICLSLSFYAVYFYTGSSPIDVFIGMSLGSNYMDYQEYFKDNMLSSFSLNKLSGILSLFFVKMYYLFSLYKLIANSFSSEFRRSFVIAMFSYLYIGFGRGTSFEMFEILISFVFGYFFLMSVNQRKIRVRNLLIILSMLIFSLALYDFNISSRYSGSYQPHSVNELLYDQNNFITQFSFSPLLFKLSNYFLVGPLYLSYFIDYIYEQGVLYFLLPLNLHILDIEPKVLCKLSFDCGFAWTPSYEIYLLKLGLLLSPLVTILLGFFSGAIFNKFVVERDFVSFSISYYVLLFFISLPVGNFVFTSSSNIIVIFCCISFWICKRFFKLI
ncbi:O-antigen polymerase [Vibrio coralliirubri]|uniref:O-antigen polymerase n=1 Tax=Vibrio coralliirubri TaxID=1516159 RepID=UPI00062FAFB8|nr:O-antigen polymerase [Vibrio coralliirubri]CDT49830.1 membrane hypothetical protein [Vibrio coralliirubri]